MHSIELTKATPGHGGKVRGNSATADNGERPDSTTSNDASQEEGAGQANDGMGDAAALLVLTYLLFISTLLVGAIVMSVFVVVRYGLVVLVAVAAAGLAMFVVAATLASVITRDAKLSKARSKIKRWHVTCKQEIMKEVQNFKEDVDAYNKLLLTQHEDDNADREDSISQDPEARTASVDTRDDVGDEDSSRLATKSQAEEQEPKSLIFRSAAAITNKSFANKSSTKKVRSVQMKQKRRWSKRELQSKRRAKKSSYQPPAVV